MIKSKKEQIEHTFNNAVANREAGNSRGAIKDFLEVLRLHPRHMDAHYLLGTIYAETGDLKKGLKHLKLASKISPNAQMVLNNLGLVYRLLGERSSAAKHYVRALQSHPEMVEAGNNLISLMNDPETDINAIKKPLRIEIFSRLGTYHQLRTENALAIAAFRKALELDTDNERLIFAIAALSGEPLPRMSEDHVKSIFDNYANVFEKHLVDKLGYRGHIDLVALAEEIQPEGLGSILDLGCGTGLVGEVLSTPHKRLVGIDLSSRMIEKARAKKIYDDLLTADINKALAENNEYFETVIASDTFIYLGDLGATFTLVRDRLAEGGVFVFSIETGSESTTYSVTDGDRYAHSPTYIRSLASDLGLDVIAERTCPIRKHGDIWMDGTLYGLRGKTKLDDQDHSK